MIRMDTAGGLAVTTTVDASAALQTLTSAEVPAKLAAADAGLWGPDAAEEAAIRLGWIDTFTRSRSLVSTLDELRTRLRGEGLTRVVLAGMGGSSLAPEVICRTLDVPLTVLDTTDPGQVSAALAEDLAATVVVVSSKSGGTVETESIRRAYAQAFTDAGIKDVGKHFVVVTDPGSPLEQLGKAMNATVILADPNVGGRYSALTAFGLVPAALAGVNITDLLDEAAAFAASIPAEQPDNPALLLGAVLASRDTIAIADDGSGIVGLGDWAEQLIAESTGKDGKGVLPVVVESPVAPGLHGPGVLSSLVGGSKSSASGGSQLNAPDVAVNGPLGAQFLCWELATAYAGRLIGIDPFNQPNVTESKNNTKAILESGLDTETPDFTEGAIAVYGTNASTVVDALIELTGQVRSDGYLAIMAYLDREADSATAETRALLAELLQTPVTFGWGPRFLHSTGQFHKGGRPTGVFLQITGDSAADLEVPGRDYTFGGLQAAQAAGDRRALRDRQRPLLHLHLSDRDAGVAQLLAAAKELGES
ncbi:glucose-6-phosphate isomerase [Stackebrandtia nassauensis]|uniref:Phosphoglucose isomerase (PGI) n=1 Tax=Stackebrandtia nassauensis (strain DSM 44728 / CIP 108903 / NRRL B-16338 / NBRC 102104 / LLR-40K-21) TaxID=446470 RepID=D3Q4S3_STANL|nr:glucose-6-phosphate isomerase [Stackebrandtia nassauensis]ADD42103.1 phosphoglucose isomerase (PGI) [Stackebrandtia nassauensis DSM 44728]